ncbi:DUF6513 domain-containing protein [Azospirillum halopraeferens]|uniref:DUF6513 domain-containing protein n=1 Tax=Azospirillum halopraeferens TaxID=34010 RepID=UPI00040E26C0|nr:DUF6513 domain-containing protein [Azospirillum halopraeferens]
MSERILFLTGHLAERRLRQVLDAMRPAFAWEVRDIGVQVAGLMTADLVHRRLAARGGVGQADRVLLPGRCRGDLDALSAAFGVPFERGPDELIDLPEHFGAARVLPPPPEGAAPPALIFAEIVEAPTLTVPQILERAAALAADGADVIDLGGLPGTPFPHLEEAVQALAAAGHRVSVDSGDTDELRRGAAAGAAFVLSLTEETLHLADAMTAVPVLIPSRPGDLDSLERAARRLLDAGRPFYADPILDPVGSGFTASVVRYHELRRRLPDAPMLMGVGNVTELTDADTTGLSAILMAMVAELAIGAVLVVQVSPHCRHAVREAAAARRLMHGAVAAGMPPARLDPALLCLRDRRPFASTPAEIAETAAGIRDPNFRIEVSSDGVHVYNRDGHHVGTDPFDLWRRLSVDDPSHAFYLGVEMARAQIAAQLGKRYAQDRELAWGVAVREPPAESGRHARPPSQPQEAAE